MTALLIYGDIGEGFWNGVTPTDVAMYLRENPGDIEIRINSGGGSVFDGNAIYNLLKTHDGRVTVHVDGYAASIASVIAMAGDEVIMGETALLMIHNPWTVAIGEAEDLRETANLLDTVKAGAVAAYTTRHDDTEQLSAWMDAETWFTADEAVAHGFADRTTDSDAEPEPSGMVQGFRRNVAGAEAKDVRVQASQRKLMALERKVEILQRKC